MQVYVYDPFVSEEEINKYNCISIDKSSGFEIADYISIHLPLNKDTKKLISYKEFKIFKKNTILINTARGGIVDEKALYEALKNNDILGAGLDVYEEEPLNDSPLFSLNNIILTPHNAALTLECRKRMSVEACENVFNFLVKKNNLNTDNIVNKKLI